MTIALHKTAIATIAGTVTGITKAFEYSPAKIDTAELPALYILTGDANNDFEIIGDDMVQTTRTYRLQVACVPTGQASAETREALIPPIIEATVNKFAGAPFLNGTIGVKNSLPKSDSGIVVLPEFGMMFVGFEVRLQVTYVVERQYLEFE